MSILLSAIRSLWSRPGRAVRPRRRTRLGLTLLEDRATPAGDGLSAVYFDNNNFTGPSVTEVAPTAGKNWAYGSPNAAIGADTFSARYSGWLAPAVTGSYSLRTYSDDGIRVWLDDAVLIDAWSPHASRLDYAPAMTLEAGKRYRLVIEYYEQSGYATGALQWRLPGTSGYTDITAPYLYSDQRNFPVDAGFTNVREAFTATDPTTGLTSTYQAVGDGIADDTAAIQAAVWKNRGTNRAVYLPNGTYRVTAPITAGTDLATAKRLIIQGQNRDNTVIKLDNADADFQNAGAAKAVLSYFDGGSTGQAFRNALYDLTINVGRDNPGAKALRFVNNNQGGIENVSLKAEASADGQRKGAVGLDLTAPWPGPGYVRNLSVEGFNYGMDVGHYQLSMIFVSTTLQSQLVAGVKNYANVVLFQNLTSRNSVPVFTETSANGHTTVIGGSFTGGSAASAAFANAQGRFLFRGVTVSGYGKAVDFLSPAKADVVAMPYELTSDAARSLWTPTSATTLGLAVQDPPEEDWGDPAQWVSVTAHGASPAAGDDTAGIQAALNWAAANGRTTVYFPKGTYTISGTITVPSSIRRVMGLDSTLDANGALKTSGAAMFRVLGQTTFERFDSARDDGNGFYVFEQAGTAPVTLKHLCLNSGRAYRSTSTGTLYVIDVCANLWEFRNQKVFAWQINPEYAPAGVPQISSIDSEFWVLGLKTEGPDTVLRATRGKVEVLGGLILPSDPVPSAVSMFEMTDAQFSLTFTHGANSADEGYTVFVTEKRGATARTFARTTPGFIGRGYGAAMPLFVGY